MLKALDSFHHRVARRITGMIPRRLPDGTWFYPPLDQAMKQAGLRSMEHYIAVRQDRMAQHIATRAIYTQCVEAHPQRGSAPNIARYWKQNWKLDQEDDDDSAYNPNEDEAQDAEEDDEDDDIDDDNPSSSSSSDSASSSSSASSTD